MSRFSVTVLNKETGIRLMPLMVNITSGDDLTGRNTITPTKSNFKYIEHNSFILQPRKTE